MHGQPTLPLLKNTYPFQSWTICTCRNFPGMVNMEKTAKKVAWSSGKELLVTTSTQRNWLVLEQKLLKNVTPERKQPDQQ